ncbi:S-layer homology domain-containing protein [Agathobaculum butyriciproducens]|uniref:S-layer homology domain-containing protein n=1 Tax=Agathobaculum butyriciproducens TaxID=1628085 RepID=UPI001D06A647|nr:S-layer homology domain-containing protein [Agathobaculum butyriciproducens]MCQ5046847.1 S-layer homology domain-containing protein [Agathobaculum butyriciproducens]
MNKWLRAVCVGAAAAAMLTASAFAANYTNCADSLHEMGLFQGTQNGYDLDRTPTRAEAAVMLVRLLGKEAEAKTLTYTAPFTDLKGWEKPYVQYLYSNGLANGTNRTTFHPTGKCTAQMYAVFLLRALGYSDTADFSYANAIETAREQGIYDTGIINVQNFLRDDAAAASYTVLSVSPKNSEGTLLDQLVSENAITEADAKRYQSLFSSYAQYREATAGMDALLHYSVNSEFASPAAVTHDGRTVMQVQTSETTVFDREKNELLTDRKMTLSAPNTSDKQLLTQSYLSDGALYHKLNGSWSAELVTAAEQEGLAAMYGRVPLVCVDSLSQRAGSWIIICADTPNAYTELLWSVESAMGDLDEAVRLQPTTVTQSVSGGTIRRQSVSAAFTLDGMTAEPVIISTLDKTGADAVLNAPK